MNTHTCHETAICVNTDGGFKCACPPNRGARCQLSCKFEYGYIADGMTRSPRDEPCKTCTCNSGVLNCEQPKCNCSIPNAHLNKCCPQCDRQLSCSHQELTDVKLMHGEQWSYQCQTCECLNGEIDCWDMKCPPLPCDNPIQSPGDCCPHCDDLCPMGNNSSSGEPCPFAGRLYESGSQFTDPNDPCVTCKCTVSIL